MPVSGPDCKWRWRSAGGGAMERRSRAVLFCIEEEQGRAEAARCGEDRRIKHWSFKGNCVIREMSFLAVLSILKHILVSFNIYIYIYMLTQENNHSQALLGQEAVIFKYLIARLLFYFLIAKHYISIICMFYRYIYCVCVCVWETEWRERERDRMYLFM